MDFATMWKFDAMQTIETREECMWVSPGARDIVCVPRVELSSGNHAKSRGITPVRQLNGNQGRSRSRCGLCHTKRNGKTPIGCG